MFWRRGQRGRGSLRFACLRAVCSPKKHAEGLPLAGNGVILSFKFKQGSMPSVQGVFGRDRILRTCKVRVPEGCMQPEEIRRGAPALAWETALSCPIVTKKLCYISLSRILCGIFCDLAEETELKRFLAVRVPEGCMQPEEIGFE